MAKITARDTSKSPFNTLRQGRSLFADIETNDAYMGRLIILSLVYGILAIVQISLMTHVYPSHDLHPSRDTSWMV